MGLLSQYRRLRQELYELFRDRVVTNMGALIGLWQVVSMCR